MSTAQTEEMRRLSEEFSGDFGVLRLLMHEPRLCSYHELANTYTIDDFYDLLEYADAQQTLREESMRQQEIKNKQKNK